MGNTAIFFGSQTGNTEAVARQIGEALGIPPSAIRSIGSAAPDDLAAYDSLVLGTSTWGIGELQEDWRAFLPHLDSIGFQGKRVALFGLGDQVSYADYFLDGMGALYDRLVSLGAEVVGAWPVDGYEHASSQAVRDAMFVGLAIDADNQEDLTVHRVRMWTDQIRQLL